ELNQQAHIWCDGVSCDRPCPDNRELSVGKAFLQEQPRLLAFPDNPFNTDEQKILRAQKTTYVRFDINDYSIPHTHIQKNLTIHADLKRLRILDNNQLIAQHQRSFDKGKQIEIESHINALWLEKTQAKYHRGQDRLHHASSHVPTLLHQSALRGHTLKHRSEEHTSELQSRENLVCRLL